MNNENLKRFFDRLSDNHRTGINNFYYRYEKANNKYYYTNSYAIIVKNKAIENTEENKDCLKNTIAGFEGNFETNYNDFNKILDVNFDELKKRAIFKEVIKIDDEFSVDGKLLQTTFKIVKPTIIKVLENQNSYTKYVVKLENEKTKECGYILPMRTY